jgi:pimeloyl-ACP methyl ester carboxylesterase
LPNLDDLAGVLVRPLQLLRTRPHDTLDRLSAYEGLGIEELFPAPTTLPRVRAQPRLSLPGFENEDLFFASSYEPIEPAFAQHYHARSRRFQTVYARRIRPKGTEGHRRLLYIHGYMQPETVVEELTLLSGMARALDMEIVHLQPPYHGRRTPRGSAYGGERFWSADIVRSFEAMRQTLFDARTLLSVLLDESPSPVGVAGISLGGAFTCALTCLEPRFDFAAPFIAHMDMGALLRDAPVLGAMRADLKSFGWSWREFGAFFERIGWDELRPAIPSDRVLLFAAEKDRFFDAQVLRKMWRRWDEPAIEWHRTTHMGFIPFMPRAISSLREFVRELPPR